MSQRYPDRDLGAPPANDMALPYRPRKEVDTDLFPGHDLDAHPSKDMKLPYRSRKKVNTNEVAADASTRASLENRISMNEIRAKRKGAGKAAARRIGAGQASEALEKLRKELARWASERSHVRVNKTGKAIISYSRQVENRYGFDLLQL